ncbi:hypothetical protein BV22DRAFT_1196658 [Leucogyrophana mollusca]|uniref:Uncharacterized protein n=1 Tax=Leucogyrophana mollusca TaxID=85980 RepID=A0ACB8BDV0_9AGAM|nr:hypothetical protein BV22DRAFT_1196658 [Leucogyrophana mollusca]
MEPSAVFLKVRSSAFVCIISFSFLWIVLLSVEMFTRWDISDRSCRSLMAILVLVNTATLLILPVLLLLTFRVWLDAARLLFLLIIQIGTAAAFTYWNPKFQCPDQTADDVGVCKLINAYTVMGCWIIPALLVVYTSYFAFTIYHQSRIPIPVFTPKTEFFEGRPSILPIMDPEMAQRHPSETTVFSKSTPKTPTCSTNLPQRQSSIPAVDGPGPRRPSTITLPPLLASRTSHPPILQPGARPNFRDTQQLTISTDLPATSTSEAYSHAAAAQEAGEGAPRSPARLSKPQRYI